VNTPTAGSGEDTRTSSRMLPTSRIRRYLYRVRTRLDALAASWAVTVPERCGCSVRFVADGMIRAIVMGHRIPAGALGPGPVQLDVRAYLVAHASGVILVDTGMDAGGLALDAALGEAGAAWPDVSHVLISHAHRDHVGALDHVRQAAPAAAVMASAAEGLPGLRPLADQDVIGPLRVFASPGHTPGHLSFADEERGVLLVGDCVGVVAGRLVRAPERFTADPEVAEQTLRSLLAWRGARMLFAHGPELASPWDELEMLLER
jgi:glyoxylase-like metal-dependent hydrolase (beta-lactamase superfamily II)